MIVWEDRHLQESKPLLPLIFYATDIETRTLSHDGGNWERATISRHPGASQFHLFQREVCYVYYYRSNSYMVVLTDVNGY